MKVDDKKGRELEKGRGQIWREEESRREQKGMKAKAPASQPRELFPPGSLPYYTNGFGSLMTRDESATNRAEEVNNRIATNVTGRRIELSVLVKKTLARNGRVDGETALSPEDLAAFDDEVAVSSALRVRRV